MADFCNQCATDPEVGFPPGDLAGLTPNQIEGEGKPKTVSVICEGCGPNCEVDAKGNCVSETCSRNHGATTAARV